MTSCERCTFLKLAVFLLIVASSRAYALQESTSTDSTPDGNNCSTTDSFLILRPPNEARENEMDTMAADVLVDTKNKLNVSRPRTLTSPKDWNEKPKLKFPKFATEERYKMASLHLDKGWFTFDFLRGFLSFVVQPYDLPVGKIITDRVNGFREIGSRANPCKLSAHMLERICSCNRAKSVSLECHFVLSTLCTHRHVSLKNSLVRRKTSILFRDN